MRAYCTILNSVYILRGLALFRSLDRHTSNFRLYVFAMDDLAASILDSVNDVRLVVVRPHEFEDSDLLSVKGSRSIAEYCWTCTPSIIRHCLVVKGELECTYLDADVWLMSDPEPLFIEMGGASILLTEHRYTPKHDQSKLSGRYCVQFMRFVNSTDGLIALNWWRDRCIEWCFAYRDGDKFGDQKYLDDWPTRFPGVHVLRHLGGGVAPWNVGRFRIRSAGFAPEVSEQENIWFPIVFYHFHGMRSYDDRAVCYAFGYFLPSDVKHLIYAPYVRELVALFSRYRKQLSGKAADGVAPGVSNDGNALRRLVRRVYAAGNTHSLSEVSTYAAVD